MRASIDCFTLPVRLAPLVLLPLLWSGCAAGDATPGSGPQIDTLPGGAVRVINSGPTAWTDTNGWRLVQERVIQPAEGSAGEIGRTVGMVADSGGNVYILEGGPARIRVYDRQSQWVRDIGREGDGPGEIRMGMFALVANDFLVIQDPNQRRLTVFRTDGRLFSSSRSQCCVWNSDFTTFADSSILIPGAAFEGAAPGASVFYRTRLDGRVTDSIVSPGVEFRDSGSSNGTWVVVREEAGGRSITATPIPLQPQARSGYFPEPLQVTGNTASYSLAVTSLRGDTLRVFSAPAPVLKVTGAERDSIFEEKISGAEKDWQEGLREIAKPGDIPNQWPAWSAVKVDGRGRIWVSRPGPTGEHSVLDVFTRDGILLGSVPVPDPRIMQGYWSTDHVYLLTEDAEGYPRVVVYRIAMED